MIPDFDYNTVPYNYLHCVQAQCPHAANCLHHQVTLHITPDPKTLSIINPAYVAGKEKDCPFFQPDRFSQFACGITHLLDNIPHVEALEIKEALYKYFKRNMYYRIRSKERLIKPEEQEFIRQLFRNKEIQIEPVFDEYIEQYEW